MTKVDVYYILQRLDEMLKKEDHVLRILPPELQAAIFALCNEVEFE
jgi:hypothetical protein